MTRWEDYSPEVRRLVEEAIESAKKAPPVYLGSFAEYADDE